MAKKPTAGSQTTQRLRDEVSHLKKRWFVAEDAKAYWRKKYEGAAAIIEVLGEKLRRLECEKEKRPF